MAMTSPAIGTGLAAPARRRTWMATLLRLAARQPLGAVSAVVLLVIIGAAVFAPLVAPYDPYISDYDAILSPPSASHLLGTDEIGRDVLSRVIYGARISLAVGFASVLIGTTIGVTIGLVSGFVSGSVDLALQRLIDVIMAFPALILALAIVSVLGSDTRNTVAAIAIVFIPYAARVVRGSVIVTKPAQFVEAARVVGATPSRVLLRHITPNILAPIIVIVSVQLANAIIVEASLSFLGLGTQPPRASLGTMLSQATRNTIHIEWWLVFGPGAAIALIVLSFNLFGDALRDYLDPKLRKGGSGRM